MSYPHIAIYLYLQKKTSDRKPTRTKMKTEKISKYFKPNESKRTKSKKPPVEEETETEEEEESESEEEEEWSTPKNGRGSRKRPSSARQGGRGKLSNKGRGKTKPQQSNGRRGKKGRDTLGDEIASDYELEEDIFQQVG